MKKLVVTMTVREDNDPAYPEDRYRVHLSCPGRPGMESDGATLNEAMKGVAQDCMDLLSGIRDDSEKPNATQFVNTELKKMRTRK